MHPKIFRKSEGIHIHILGEVMISQSLPLQISALKAFINTKIILLKKEREITHNNLFTDPFFPPKETTH